MSSDEAEERGGLSDLVNNIKKSVRWVFDRSDDTEDDSSSVLDSSDDEDGSDAGGEDKFEASQRAAPPKSILKEDARNSAKRNSAKRNSAKRSSSKRDSKRDSSRLSLAKRLSGGGKEKWGAARSSWRRASAAASASASDSDPEDEEALAAIIEDALDEEDDVVGEDEEEEEKVDIRPVKPVKPKEKSKRSSFRLSWRGSKSKSKDKVVSQEQQRVTERTIANLGAIDEDGEYKQAKLEDSNIAGIGSKEDKAQRKSAARTERCFRKAGKKVGILVCRVHNKRTKSDTPDFGLEKVREPDGSLYGGDSYIVLNTYHPRDRGTGKVNRGKLAYDIHFWLGSKSSQDEIGVAAYKSVELNALLDDRAVIHRELQYHESKLFVTYFKELKYLEGGYDSGFRKVKPVDYEPRLLQVRHSSKVTKAFEIPCKAKNMNDGDAFILDAGTVVWRWVGTTANVFEKNRSGLLQHNICEARYGKAVKRDAYGDDEEFWAMLGGSEADVRDAEHPYDIQNHSQDRLNPTDVRLWRISDATGSLEFTMEGEGKVPMRALDSDDVFLVHANIGIWVWLGSGATKQERSSAMSVADAYIEQNELPSTMTVTSIKEESALGNTLFVSLFAGR